MTAPRPRPTRNPPTTRSTRRRRPKAGTGRGAPAARAGKARCSLWPRRAGPPSPRGRGAQPGPGRGAGRQGGATPAPRGRLGAAPRARRARTAPPRWPEPGPPPAGTETPQGRRHAHRPVAGHAMPRPRVADVPWRWLPAGPGPRASAHTGPPGPISSRGWNPKGGRWRAMNPRRPRRGRPGGRLALMGLLWLFLAMGGSWAEDEGTPYGPEGTVCREPVFLQLGRPAEPHPDVQGLQSRLQDLGLYDGPLDGLFGPETAQAVRRFQQTAGLPPSGMVDPATWTALADGVVVPAAAQPTEAPPGPLSIVIDVNERTLTLYSAGQPYKSYPVAVGTSRTPSPVGEWLIVH